MSGSVITIVSVTAPTFPDFTRTGDGRMSRVARHCGQSSIDPSMTEDAAAPVTARHRSPREAVGAIRIHAPAERNRRLAGFLAAANANDQLKARWHVAQVNAERLDMSDHSWVHLQIVLNRALHLFRLLTRQAVQPSVVADFGMDLRDAEVVIAGGCLLHDLGMSIRRTDHEA